MTTTPPCCLEAEQEQCDQHRQAAKVQGHAGPRNRSVGAHRYGGPPDQDEPGTRVTPRGSRGTGRGRDLEGKP